MTFIPTTLNQSDPTEMAPWHYMNPVTQAPGYVWPSDTSEQRQAAQNNYYYRAAESQGKVGANMDTGCLNMGLLDQNAFQLSSGIYPSSSSSSSSGCY